MALSIRRFFSSTRTAQALHRALSFVEPLEGRQMFSADLLDADPLPPLNDPVCGTSYSTTYATTALSATAASAHETRVTLDVRARVAEDRAKRLTATVTAVDPEAPTPTGKVAFFTTGDSRDLRSVYPVVSLPSADGGSTTAYLLGTAALDESGQARFTLNEVSLGVHALVAVYLGADAPIAPQAVDGLPTIEAAPTGRRLVGLPTSSKAIRNTVIVDTGGKAFRIGFGRIRTRDTVPDDAHDIPDAGVRLQQEEHDVDTTTAQAYFNPVDGPIRIDVRAKKVTVDDDGVPRIYYDYDYRITPVTVPAALADLEADFAGSASAASAMHVVVNTALDIRQFGSTTVTNPPTITASIIRRDDGTLLGADWPDPPVRGGIQTASAGVKPAGTTTAPPVAATIADDDDQDLDLGDKSIVTAGTLPRRRMPTGVVFFDDLDNGTRIGKAFLDADGNATFVPASRSIDFRELTIRARYKGDADYKASRGETDLTLTRTQTETTLILPKTTFQAGEQITWYAEVNTKSPDLVKPTGMVRIHVDGDRVAAMNLGSTAPVRFTLEAGTHTIYARYNSDADNLRSFSEEIEITVEKAPSTLSVFPSVVTLVPNEPVKMGSHVGTANWQLLKPTGNIRIEQLDDDGNVIDENVATAPAYENFEFDFDFEEDVEYHFKGHYEGDDNTLASASGFFILVLKGDKIEFKF